MASTAERRRTGGAAGPARGRDAALMGVGGLGPRALSHQHGGELQVEGPSAEPVPPRQVGAGELQQDDQAGHGAR